MNKLMIVCLGVFLNGCYDFPSKGDIEQLRTDVMQVDSKIDSVKEQFNIQNSIIDRHDLYRDIASSQRLASIVANYMNSLSLISMKDNDLKLVKTISDELKDDLHDEVMYNAIFNQGYAYSVTKEMSGFNQYNKWFINVNPGEYFSDGSFKYSLKLFFYETLSKPTCDQGQPTLVYKLINKIGSKTEVPIFELLESSAAWTVMPLKQISLNQIRDFRILVEARCQ